MQSIPAYPTFFDFTKPRMGHAFHATKEVGIFGSKFKILDCTIFCDSTSDNIRKGDILYVTLPSGLVGMYRIIDMKQDPEVENTFYCNVVGCGYRIGKRPSYFKDFADTWNKEFPPVTLVKVPEPSPKKYAVDEPYKYHWYDDDGTILIGLGMILFCLVSSVFYMLIGGH